MLVTVYRTIRTIEQSEPYDTIRNGCIHYNKGKQHRTGVTYVQDFLPCTRDCAKRYKINILLNMKKGEIFRTLIVLLFLYTCFSSCSVALLYTLDHATKPEHSVSVNVGRASRKTIYRHIYFMCPSQSTSF